MTASTKIHISWNMQGTNQNHIKAVDRKVREEEINARAEKGKRKRKVMCIDDTTNIRPRPLITYSATRRNEETICSPKTGAGFYIVESLDALVSGYIMKLQQYKAK